MRETIAVAHERIFGLGLNLTDLLPKPSFASAQWTAIRSSPIPLRVSPGIAPGSPRHEQRQLTTPTDKHLPERSVTVLDKYI